MRPIGQQRKRIPGPILIIGTVICAVILNLGAARLDSGVTIRHACGGTVTESVIGSVQHLGAAPSLAECLTLALTPIPSTDESEY